MRHKSLSTITMVMILSLGFSGASLSDMLLTSPGGIAAVVPKNGGGVQMPFVGMNGPEFKQDFRGSGLNASVTLPESQLLAGASSISKSTLQMAQVVYHGNVKSRVFHKPGCQHYNCKNCVAVFKNRDEAIQAGYRPCRICGP